jgi:Domain of unknown function (DUF1830)
MIMVSHRIISSRIQCTYRNESDRFQVIRVEGNGIERTIAAGQALEFEAHGDSYLDIYTYEIATMILRDRMPCHQLTGSAAFQGWPEIGRGSDILKAF